ncbi:MAG: hypothetical protein ACKERG_04630 [Candidatus Hodgkinia cicadicola]
MLRTGGRRPLRDACQCSFLLTFKAWLSAPAAVRRLPIVSSSFFSGICVVKGS